MFEYEIMKVLLEEAEKEYQEAKKVYEEEGISTETLKNLWLKNMARIEMKKKLDSITPKA